MISDNYVTGDNIYLRELQNFFFEVLGIMSITHYGAIGNGITDNYGPLQVAIDDANRRKIQFLYVPYGRYRFRGELINREDIIFIGNSKAKIFNDRTGEEIEVVQFGLPYMTGHFVKKEGDTMSGALRTPTLMVGDRNTASGTGNMSQGHITASNGVIKAEGTGCYAGGHCSSGQISTANNGAFAYGYTYRSGSSEGGTILAKGNGSLAIGSAMNGHKLTAEWNGAVATGWASNADIKATAGGSRAGGYSHSTGGILASGLGSLAYGSTYSASAIKATGTGSIALGYSTYGSGTEASGSGAVAIGDNVKAVGYHSRAIGIGAVANGNRSFSIGQTTIANRLYQIAMGKYNTEESGDATTHSTSSGLLILGNGADNDNRSNAMRLTFAGDLYIAGTLHSNGADYAESVEWTDGNPNEEDRTGRFVVLENGKMRIANSQDGQELMGVVSAFPSILGDSYDEYWHNKYVTDAYGRIQYETRTMPAELDEKGEVIRPEETIEVPILNPDFDPTQEYIPRRFRKEYGNFAMLGKLIVEDDGTCEVGGYCYPNNNGIATKKYEGFYILERIDANHIKIFVK